MSKLIGFLYIVIAIQVSGQVTPGRRVPPEIQSRGKDVVSNQNSFKAESMIDQSFGNSLTIQKLQKSSKLFTDGGANGGGGDEIGLQFYAAFESAVAQFKQNDLQTFKKFEKQLMAAAKVARFVVVDIDLDLIPYHEVLQNSIAINIPEMSLIIINRERWKLIDDSRLREGLALHEILSLARIESTGVYTYSGRYVSMQKASLSVFKSLLFVSRINQLRGANTAVMPDEVEVQDDAFFIMSNAEKVCRGVVVQPVCFGESACRQLQFANGSLIDSEDRKVLKVKPLNNMWADFELGHGRELAQDVMSNVSYRPHLRECAKALRDIYNRVLPVAVRKFPVAVHMDYFQPIQMALFNMNLDSNSIESFKKFPENWIVVYWRNPGSLSKNKK